MTEQKAFLSFAKPFIESLKETYKVMMQNDIEIHNPKIVTDSKVIGDITATIGMNGILEKADQKIKFQGMVAITWKETVYLKMASAMLFQEYTAYGPDVADAGAEVLNIVMGNAKKQLNPLGYKIEMATPSTIKGTDHEIKYPKDTTIIESVVTSSFGEFTFKICYQDAII